MKGTSNADTFASGPPVGKCSVLVPREVLEQAIEALEAMVEFSGTADEERVVDRFHWRNKAALAELYGVAK